MSSSQTKLTYNEYCLFPDDGRRHEIIDGEHFMNPAPSTYHQTVSRRLQYFLYTAIELPGLGQVFNAPIDLQFSPYDVVQPDLVVVMNDRKIITPAKIKGVPNLTIEILSPSSEQHDRELKFSLYERHHVDEYWIVDPLDHKIQQSVLDANRKRYETSLHSDAIATATITPTVEIALTEVW
ncbi:MAG: Uma2 family endonuclease [Planctomycetota bacterium]